MRDLKILQIVVVHILNKLILPSEGFFKRKKKASVVINFESLLINFRSRVALARDSVVDKFSLRQGT